MVAGFVRFCYTATEAGLVYRNTVVLTETIDPVAEWLKHRSAKPSTGVQFPPGSHDNTRTKAHGICARVGAIDFVR